MSVRPGVLALQGDFAEHQAILLRLGLEASLVRSRQDLEEVDSLIIPGGESTTMIKMIDRFDLRDLLVKKIRGGMPVFGTCAGAIVLADRVSDGEEPLGVLGVAVRRNAYGRQRESFETDLEVEGIHGGPVHAVFIRAPVFEETAEDVEVMATWAERPVVIRQGQLFVSAFHPELTDDTRMHEYFFDKVREAN